jgi:putative SOS response-associated peptidase YedK
MCGRFANQYTWREVHAFSQPMNLVAPDGDPVPAYNIAPTHTVWVLIPQTDGALKAMPYRWGLIPSWAEDARLAFNSINARIETVASKPTFRLAWQRRRCVVPVSGYFEWVGAGVAKTPFFVYASSSPILMLGGIYERWESPGAAAIDSFSIVTTTATGAIASMHDRMPIILPPAALGTWLHPNAEFAAARILAFPPPPLAFHPVSKAVGNVRNQGPQLIAPRPQTQADAPASGAQADLFASRTPAAAAGAKSKGN